VADFHHELAAYSSEIQQPAHTTAAPGKHPRTRQAASSDPEQGRARSLHPGGQTALARFWPRNDAQRHRPVLGAAVHRRADPRRHPGRRRRGHPRRQGRDYGRPWHAANLPDVLSLGIASRGEPRSRPCQVGTGAPQGRSARVGIDSRQHSARGPAVVSRRLGSACRRSP
jgi:hypothetical protein